MTQFEIESEHVRERLAEVRGRVDVAAGISGRQSTAVEIVLATKYVSVDAMAVLSSAGVTLVGENRAQDLIAKHERFGSTFTFDFIGHLQSRKTKDVVPRVRLIHSVDSLSVVKELQRVVENNVNVLLEVNVAAENTKSGVLPEAVDVFLEEAAEYSKVHFSGLMCMPPLTQTADEAARYFVRTRELALRLSEKWRGRYSFVELSMGTSADYEVAVREGATKVRVGTGVLA